MPERSDSTAAFDSSIFLFQCHVNGQNTGTIRNTTSATGETIRLFQRIRRRNILGGVLLALLAILCALCLHSVDMLRGWHYSASDADDTLVVLDENAAWRLFGGTGIAGLFVELNGHPCTVAEGDAYGETPRMYLALSYAARMGLAVPVTSYEAVLPEVVSGFGAETVKTALALGDKQVKLKTLTGRFTLHAGLRSAGELAYRAQRASAIEYPWWENHAVAIGGQNALWSALALVFGLSEAITTVGLGTTFVIEKRRRSRLMTGELWLEKADGKEQG